jgi:cytochrome P450/NADPH-cytochrome P450 reductase
LRETLRLHPTAPAFTLQAKGDQVLGGKYSIKDKQFTTVMLAQLHRDPEVYGADSEDFRPERMEGKAFTDLPPNSWKVSFDYYLFL